MATSFTKAILVARKVFSSNLTISAVVVSGTTMGVSMTAPYRLTAKSEQFAVTPPITLGVVLIL